MKRRWTDGHVERRQVFSMLCGAGFMYGFYGAPAWYAGAALLASCIVWGFLAISVRND